MKFALSIGIYAWTIGWIMHDLLLGKVIKPLSYTIGWTMIIEMVILLVQSARGVRSHFNISSPLDSLLFGMMGILIMINTLCVILILIRSLLQKTPPPDLYINSIRIALVIFLMASAIGGQMISQQQHNVGVADGGPGIIFLNWSTTAGDLRIAHFLGLHSIQIIPLGAYLIDKTNSIGIYVKGVIFTVLLILYLGLLFSLYLQAIHGHPLITL